MTATLIHGDCLVEMAGIETGSVDAVITDPPYGLKFMGKDWDRGVPGVAFWQAALRVAKPGAPLLAFGGTRTHHRLMCAIEDAGWILRDVACWLYGSGFPKSHDISKAIDKAAGAEREVVGRRTDRAATPKRDFRGGKFHAGAEHKNVDLSAITAPATPDAQTWDGWGTALKPAWEPIILAMKPLDGTFAHNALAHGVAGLNIDGARIATNESDRAEMSGRSGGHATYGPDDINNALGKGLGRPLGHIWKPEPKGRWPANLILSHSPGCQRVGVRKVKGSTDRGSSTKSRGGILNNTGEARPVAGTGYASPDGTETVEAWECVEGCAVAMLDRQSGERKGAVSNGSRGGGLGGTQTFAIHDRPQVPGYADTGTASRYFLNLPGERAFYCAKSSRSERTNGGTIDNAHATVKPLSLMRYLCRLTRTPTGGVVLDPFMGSGSTGVAAVMEGRDFVGIELDPDYFAIAQARIEAAQNEMVQLGFGG